ncbi:hypothetical protein PXK17_20950 [Phaeobacter gallaeciensis]|uniref:Uncharacterized protein n=1 Tax=Phaeobacter gallaeciensis TaxID=60890 RepID=A0ABD4XG31_9RHOB|nr:hypothetical protein [Phaeobacter gallaeciensis]MDE4147077.1 hypothetical protein [Phaeobacter gallaeciensis]MDE4159715.1 hypothetical protein [Phaeobacter gallaeciensis]MDE4163936.1 hypothetical protein [Phaeobacter gallaeciensis]MDE4168159.1 hypothetical protein [Phaeobacter gallaeciensis]MDE4172402.1 hypothetical protein [Phaeobacter gallaeciensis]
MDMGNNNPATHPISSLYGMSCFFHCVAIFFLFSASVTVTPANGDTVLESVIAYADSLEFDTIATNIAETNLPLALEPSYSNGIDGTIINFIQNKPTPYFGTDTYAVENIDSLGAIDLDNINTIGIGAVNTGEVLLDRRQHIAGILNGNNADLQQAVTASTNAITQRSAAVGSTQDMSALILNMASNSQMVKAKVDNTVNHLSGSISQITSTAIGAVNTGQIQSGISAIVRSISAPST